MRFDVVIIGGGAAGLFCAMHAGMRGKTVLVLEHNDRVGRKIIVSGGGRCNFTNLYSDPDSFLSSNPRFVYSSLARYTPHDFIELVERHKIAYYEKKLGQLFCVESSKQIVQMLLDECSCKNVDIRLSVRIQSVEKTSVFRLFTNQGTFESNALVIATGGLSIPKIGATDFGYRIARQFGLNVIEPRPGLVPLTFDRDALKLWENLRGVSLNAVVRCGAIEFRDNLLFTHRGLSGPAILQVSSYWNRDEEIYINILPEENIDALLESNKRGSMILSNLLSNWLPKRFTQVWCNCCVENKPMRQYTPKELAFVGNLLRAWPLRFDGNEGFSKAEVTLGGVDTAELSGKTMESQKVTGLYFIGEVLDVTGHLGGHNFQWAWSSGYAAGAAI